MTSSPLEATVIVQRSTPGYARAIFAAYDRGEIVLPHRLGGATDGFGVAVRATVDCPDDSGWLNLAVAPRHDPAPAQIATTSGTTGAARAVLLSHAALGDVTARLVEIMALDGDVREYLGVPATYSFGFGQVRAVAAVGGRSYFPPHGFRIDEFAAMLRAGEINALCAVPSLLRAMLDERPALGGAGDALRWLEIGSQAMSAAEKAMARALFPNARIVQHYGTTEASRSTFLDISAADDDALASVGRPTGAVELRITPDRRIAIRGPHLASGIVAGGAVVPLVDDGGWFVTGDHGHLAGGLLRFDGRADDVINIAGIKVQPDAFEARLRERLGALLRGVGVARGHDRLRGEIAVIAHTPDAPPPALLRDAAGGIARDYGVPGAVALLPVEALPLTDTGKVRRERVTQLFADATPPPDHSTSEVRAAFVAAFGAAALEGGASFDSLGGDSLAYLSVMLALEQRIAALPDDWSSLPIDALERLAEPSGGVGNIFVATFGPAGGDPDASFDSLGGDSLSYLAVMTALEERLGELPDDWASLPIASLAAIEHRPARSEPPTARRPLPCNLDTLRSFACLLVVALHVIGLPGQGLEVPPDAPLRRLMEALDLVRMPLFAALAGYLYAMVPARRDGYGSFVLRKVRQLLLPLAAVKLATWLATAAETGFVDVAPLGLNRFGHLWYLYSLFAILVAVGTVDAFTGLVRRHLAAITSGVMLVWLAMLVLADKSNNNPLFLFPFFALGMAVQHRPALVHDRRVIVSSIAAVAIVLVLQQSFELYRNDLFESSVPAWLAGGALILLLMRFMPRIAAFDRLAPYSYAIYLWHYLTIRIVRDQIPYAGWPHGRLSLFCLTALIAVGVPIAIYRIAVRLPRAVSIPLVGR